MLDLEVHPGQSICTEKWDFVLGMHISQAIAVIQSLVTSIHQVQLLYSITSPLENDICIKLTQDGIQLHFDPICQRLKTIEVFSMQSLKLRYGESYFNSREFLPTIEQIDNSFGATHPGIYNSERQELAINFPGLSFYFFIDKKSQPFLKKDTRYLQFPPGQSPLVTNMLIYHGTSTTEAVPPPMPSSCMHNMVFLDSLHVIRKDNKTKGLRLNLYMDDGRQNNGKKAYSTDLMFGASCQEVSSRLGAPSKVFYKCEDKMKIHSNAQARKTMTRSDFFFNYFTLGFDVLFDARTQRAKKFVLHTNFPGHYDFNVYHRCDFELPITCPMHPSEGSQLIEQPVDLIVKSITKWDVLLLRIKPDGRPIVLHRSSSTNTTNPFGSTFCHGYQDMIFEVMSNDHISTITLYENEHIA